MNSTWKKQRQKAIEEREAAEQEILAKIPAQQKDYFHQLLKVAQQAGSYGEEHSYYCEDYCFFNHPKSLYGHR